jgi:hypothetical protein
VPQDIHFPDGYRISVQAVHRAFRRAIVRLPNAEAAELRKLDSERLEEMLLSLQAGIRQGDSRSIEVGVRVLTHKPELNGYKSPARVEMSGTHLVQAATARRSRPSIRSTAAQCSEAAGFNETGVTLSSLPMI